MGFKDKVGNVKEAFSKKAKFSFYYIDEDSTSISDDDWDGPYKIDINPTEFAEYYSESFDSLDGMSIKRKKKSRKHKKGKVGQGKGLVDKFTSISLIFDLAEKYDSATSRIKAGYKGKNSMAGSSKFKKFTKGMKKGLTQGSPDQDTAISILNPQWSVYAKLEELMDEMSNYNNCLVKFEWGAKKVIGVVERINTNFTYFSSHGAPLRAEVSMTIQHDESRIKVSNNAKSIGTQNEFTVEEINKGLQEKSIERELEANWGDNGDAINGLFE